MHTRDPPLIGTGKALGLQCDLAGLCYRSAREHSQIFSMPFHYSQFECLAKKLKKCIYEPITQQGHREIPSVLNDLLG